LCVYVGAVHPLSITVGDALDFTLVTDDDCLGLQAHQNNRHRTSPCSRLVNQRIAGENVARRSGLIWYLNKLGASLRNSAQALEINAIADGLNEQRIPTARGNGQWSAVTVKRVLQRLEG
jgi:hypothetical protein